MEMKLVCNSLDFEDKLAQKRLLLEGRLPKVKQAHPEVEGVILMATKAQKDGRSWQKPTTLVQLFKVGAKAGDWQTLAGKAPKKAARGKAKVKPPLQELWDTLPSEKLGGQQFFCVGDFLRALGLPSHSIKKRSASFDEMISLHGSSDQLFQQRIVGRSGHAVWLGSRSALRALYTAL